MAVAGGKAPAGSGASAALLRHKVTERILWAFLTWPAVMTPIRSVLSDKAWLAMAEAPR